MIHRCLLLLKINSAASDMNHDLEVISQWAFDWEMSINPDPRKQAVELRFSMKRVEVNHPEFRFNNIPVRQVDEHKHLGIILDPKLSFSAHIKAVISKARKGIGLLKHLSKFLPRHALNELFKLYVCPYLEYGDVIYHMPAKVCEFSSNVILATMMEKLESVEYAAALAITGTWRGSSRMKLCNELGWESLNPRWWSRRLTVFYKMINNLTPGYTRDPISEPQLAHYSLRNQDVIGRIRARTDKFKSSFYPKCLAEWNELDHEIRLSPSVAIFKKKLLAKIRPPARSTFGIHDPIGFSYLTQLRVGLSKLCLHKFRYNFRDSINPMCPINDGIETMEHFLLLCHTFEAERRSLLAGVSELLQPYGYTNLPNKVLKQILLYGDKDLPNCLNRNILDFLKVN